MRCRLFDLLRGLWRAREGIAALELGLVAGPFLMLTFGSVEFGRLMWTREALQASAISGARCMGVKMGSCMSGGSYSSTSTTSYVNTVASGWSVSLPSGAVALNNSTSCAGVTGAASFSQVTITYTFQTMLPHLLMALANAQPMTITACFPNQSTT